MCHDCEEWLTTLPDCPWCWCNQGWTCYFYWSRPSHAANSVTRRLAGSGAEVSKDGSYLAASFSQPTSLCIEGRTIFVHDTAIEAVKMVTPTTSLCKFLEIIDVLCKMTGIHLRGVPGEDHTIEETVASLSKISSTFELWVKEMQEKRWWEVVTQGPQGTISAKSRRSLEIVTESLSMLGRCLTEINPG